MATIESLSVIVRCDSVHETYPGGWDQFVKDVPRLRLGNDFRFVHIDFVMPDDAERYLDLVVSSRLDFRNVGHTKCHISGFDTKTGYNVANQALGQLENSNLHQWFFSATLRCISAPNGSVVQLTPHEFDFIEKLHEIPYTPIERTSLLIRIFGRDDYYTSRALDSLVRRLRTKMKKADDRNMPLKTAHGVGYVWSI